jgi:hypothetical protein
MIFKQMPEGSKEMGTAWRLGMEGLKGCQLDTEEGDRVGQ